MKGCLLYDTTRDVENETDHYLHFNENQGDGSHSSLKIDILSNGFKVRATHQHTNNDGDVYQYVAFAESHVKYANAR